MVDLMRYLMGDAVSVYSRQENLFHRDVQDYTVEDVSATIFGFHGGAMGVAIATNGAIPVKWINDYRLVSQKLTAEFTNANNASSISLQKHLSGQRRSSATKIYILQNCKTC